MKKEDLLNGIGNIDSKYIEEAENSMKTATVQSEPGRKTAAKRSAVTTLKWALATAACICLAVGLVFLLNPVGENNNSKNVAGNTNVTPSTALQTTQTPSGPTQPIDYTNRVASLSDGFTRQNSETGSLSEEMKKVIANYAFNLFNADLEKHDENRMVSPYSALSALALCANGMQGESLKQLENYIGTDILSLNRGLYAYADYLKSVEGSKFKTANSIWIDDRMSVNHDFLQTNADWYDAGVYSGQLAAPEMVDAINDWCDVNTDGMIPEIVDSIDECTLMMLINAICFDASWNKQYSDEMVRAGLFTNADGTTSNVNLMTSDENTIIYSDNYKSIGFVKEYSGGQYSFVGLLPDEGQNVKDFASGLTGEKWLELWENREVFSSRKVKLPEFKYETTINLAEIMKDAGVTAMFAGAGYSGSDFSKMGTCPDGDLFVGGASQKTVIDVNPKGTKAAAVTTITVVTECAPMYLEFTRPFVYAVVDNFTGLPVFLGVVTGL